MNDKKFGRYELRKELGRGGMATVYLAYDPMFDREVAIKVLPREFLHDPMFKARFEREAKTVAALEHPAIVPVYDFGEEEGQPFLVMRFMPGGTLADKITQGQMSLEQIDFVLRHIAPALDKAHSQGIIHRDLKPANILFDDDGNPYLSDFGIVKISQATAVTGSVIIGTPAYMSPEQARGEEEIDGRSDVYSLGVVLFEMLTGRMPYKADSPLGMALKHISDPIPNVRAITPDVPVQTEGVLERAMAKDTGERYQNAKELANAISTIVRKTKEIPAAEETRVSPGAADTLTDTPAELVQETVESVKPPIREKRRISMSLLFGAGAGAVVLLSIAIFAAWYFIFREDETPSTATLIAQATDIASTPTLEASPTQEINTSGTPIGAVSAEASQTPTQIPEPSQTDTPTEVPTPTITSRPSSTMIGGGGLIVFHSDRTLNYDIFVIRPDGSGLIQVTDDQADDYYPDISPDGSKIAFVSDRDGNPEIYVLDFIAAQQIVPRPGVTDHLVVTRLTNNQDVDTYPTWSPDGTRIAFSSERDGNSEIYVMNADGSNQENISDFSLYDGEPVWSPTDDRIAFISTRHGNQELCIMNSDGSNVQRVTENIVPDHLPAWHPNGERLAFWSNYSIPISIFHINADGSDLVQANQSAYFPSGGLGDFSTMSISPDGMHIAFGGDAPGFTRHYTEIFIMDLDGANQVQLTDHIERNGSPHWTDRDMHYVGLTGGLSGDSGDQLHHTDFDNLDGWYVPEIPSIRTSGSSVHSQDGKLMIEIDPENTAAFAFHEAYLGEADIQIDTFFEPHGMPYDFGIICRATDTGWYEFRINTGGLWSIWKYSSSLGYILLGDGGSSAINSRGESNELTAQCVGRYLSLIVNGVVVSTVRESTFTRGWIGVTLLTPDIPKAGVIIDYLTVSVP